MKQLKLSALLFALFLGLGSCSSVSSLNPLKMLTGNNWVLSSLMGGGLDMFSGALPSLSFMDDGKLSGFGGCNSFSGDFELSGTNLNLDPGAMTKKACPGGGEDKFMSALKNVSNFKVDKDKLTLLDGASELMTLIPQSK
ncbi:META domain-containing protein [Echinicola sp. CAU 1574]|uniref:META domain-containing protein n=1 Tax=Echinicola arenosa TaxID=2774144 RepID=A0ABR9AGV2_9BACT|nr:META domain-containing protein [Echinicola arenosa]MBD8487945.1 META domain-containing protein [Echinicola arenosa]